MTVLRYAINKQKNSSHHSSNVDLSQYNAILTVTAHIITDKLRLIICINMPKIVNCTIPQFENYRSTISLPKDLFFLFCHGLEEKECYFDTFLCDVLKLNIRLNMTQTKHAKSHQ